MKYSIIRDELLKIWFSFMFFFFLLPCEASLQLISNISSYFHPCSIFPSSSSCLLLLSSHRTLTAKLSEECSRRIQLLLPCSFKADPNPPRWSQWRKSMLVTGGLLELKLTTLGRICDNLKDVGLLVFKSLGLLFCKCFSKLHSAFSECLNRRIV